MVAPHAARGRPGIAGYRLGGKTYALKTVPQCAVCTSEYRLDIESAIAKGTPFLTIHREISLRDPDFAVTAQSLRTHYDRGHMPLGTEVVRRTLERRAKERGRDIEAAVDVAVDGVAFAELVLRRSVEMLAEGKIEPTMMDGLQAAKIVEQFAPHEQAAAESAYVEAFMIFHETAQQIMTESQFQEFGRRLGENEALRALLDKYSGDDSATVVSDGDDFYDDGELVQIEEADSKRS